MFASTEPEKKGKGISAFVVQADIPGLVLKERTRILSPHPIGVIGFEECVVPKSQLLGKEGEGLKIALGTLLTSLAKAIISRSEEKVSLESELSKLRSLDAEANTILAGEDIYYEEASKIGVPSETHNAASIENTHQELKQLEIPERFKPGTRAGKSRTRPLNPNQLTLFAFAS